MKLQRSIIIFAMTISFNTFSGLNGYCEDNYFLSGISGTDTLKIGLQESILMALERNPTVTIELFEPKKAEKVAAGIRSDFEPALTAKATKSKSKLETHLGTKPEPVDLFIENMQYQLGISEQLPTGTTISLNTSMTGQTSNLYTDQYSSSTGITVNQSLLQGFGTGYNLASLRKAKIDVEISKSELRGVAESVLADVEQTYWSLYLAAEEINIREKSLELAQQQFEESNERVKVGKLSELELAAVRAETANRKEALIDARSRYEQTRLKFLYLLNPSGKELWSKIPSPTEKPFVPVDTLDTIENHEKLGLKYRPDLEQAKLNLEKGELDLARTRNGLLPRLDFFITFGRTNYAESFNDAKPDINSPFYTINGGVNFSLPVINRKARASNAVAKYSRQQMEMSLGNMQRLVEWDIRSAYIEVIRSRQQIDATKTTRELQEQKLLAEQEKFRVGKSTNILVLQAQRDFISSRLDEASAMVSYLNSLVNLYQMEGTLLDRRGIASFK